MRPRHLASLAAKFVLWGSEWFRREYAGSTRNWVSLTEPIALQANQATVRALADAGLQLWRIPPLKINGTHHRLAAIARQGGFPVAAIEGNGAGWAPRFLERLVGLLLNESRHTLDVAEHAAEALLPEVPRTWQSTEMRVVSAELALAIVRLRRGAEARGVTGQLVSAWLDQHDPGWRDELPLTVSSAAAQALLDGLMRAPILRGGFTNIGARRRLLMTTQGRREQVELTLEGVIGGKWCGATGRTLAAEWSRLRLYASSEFARHIAGRTGGGRPRRGRRLGGPADREPLHARPALQCADHDGAPRGRTAHRQRVYAPWRGGGHRRSACLGG